MGLQLSEISICFSILGFFFGCILIAYLLKMITENQHHAYFGDKHAMAHLLLPCYKPLIRSLWIANILFIFIQLFILLLSPHDSYLHSLSIQFCQLSLITLQSIPGVLLCQPSVSRSGFWRTGLLIFLWWILSTITWILSHQFQTLISAIVFISISAVPPFLMSLGMLIGVLPSRIRLGSRSNRGCIEFILIHSLCYLAALIVFLITPYPLHMAFAIMIFFSSQIFPITFYFCLLADTKFWRGLGKHNSGGLISSNNSLPELTMGVVANEFQAMIADVSSYFIDFAFIRVGPMIGSGASADIYFGEYRRKPVVLKISTPPEVTAAELLIIRKETLIHSKLSHPCIVKFIGVCVRPPQIGMVVEYCDNGNLRDSLQHFFFQWTPQRRMIAMLDACRAVSYVHSMGFMHRDIKAENFLVTNLWKIKLGDFGESIEIQCFDEENQHPTEDDGEKNSYQREPETRKMTILGTIAYMAPELVEGRRHYTESIDVYALAVTLWQIWTGIEPYQNIDTFSLYKLIMSGTHPDLPKDSPDGLNEAFSAGWNLNPKQRITSQELLDRIDLVAKNYLSQSDNNPSMELSLTPPGGTVKLTLGENENPLRVNAIPSEDLEMLGSSSFFDDSHSLSADVEDVSPYFGSTSPFKFLKGWNHHSLASSHLHSHSVSRTTISHSAVTPKRLFQFFSGDPQEDDRTEEEGNRYKREINHDPVVDDDQQTDEVNQDLYQSYSRKSTLEAKQNPIASMFNLHKSHVFGQK